MTFPGAFASAANRAVSTVRIGMTAMPLTLCSAYASFAGGSGEPAHGGEGELHGERDEQQGADDDESLCAWVTS